MILKHIALVGSSAEPCARFFGELLGCRETGRKRASADLMDMLFGRKRECEIINYERDGLLFEVFVDGGLPRAPVRIDHICLGVSGLDDLLKRAEELGFEVRRAQKGDKWVVFLLDGDDNLFEVVEGP